MAKKKEEEKKIVKRNKPKLSLTVNPEILEYAEAKRKRRKKKKHKDANISAILCELILDGIKSEKRRQKIAANKVAS